MTRKESKKKPREYVGKETRYKWERAAVVSRRLCFIWAAIVLSFPPTKHHTKLSGTEHHCQAATSLHHQNILHCLHLQLCSSMFNRLGPDGRVSQKPWTHRGWKSTPSLHIASTCIHLQFSGTSRPLAIPPSPLFQSSLSNTFETLLGCLPTTDLAAHWKPRNENRIQ